MGRHFPQQTVFTICHGDVFPIKVLDNVFFQTIFLLFLLQSDSTSQYFYGLFSLANTRTSRFPGAVKTRDAKKQKIIHSQHVWCVRWSNDQLWQSDLKFQLQPHTAIEKPEYINKLYLISFKLFVSSVLSCTFQYKTCMNPISVEHVFDMFSRAKCCLLCPCGAPLLQYSW